MTGDLAVLLPHYNNHEGLEATLESMLFETASFTLFIYDDCSINFNDVKYVVNQYTNKLDIVLQRNRNNLGITKTLNKAITHILGLKQFSFIARIDAGDLCLNNRFKNQKRLFSENPNLGLVSSWVNFVNMDGEKQFVFKPPEKHSTLKKAIYIYNPFIHPAVMFKSDIFRTIGYYDEHYEALEDHAFFFRIIKKYDAAICKNILLQYQMNPLGISSKKRKLQTKHRIKLFIKEFNWTYYALYGIIRAVVTHITPRSILLKLKKVFY